MTSAAGYVVHYDVRSKVVIPPNHSPAKITQLREILKAFTAIMYHLFMEEDLESGMTTRSFMYPQTGGITVAY